MGAGSVRMARDDTQAPARRPLVNAEAGSGYSRARMPADKRWRERALVAASLAWLVACGGPQLREGAFRGRAEGPPSMHCLPETDVADSEYSEHMRRGLALAEASFDVAAPSPPASRAAGDLTDWSNGPLRAWLAQKSSAIHAARQELDLAAEETHRQRILGGAVVGLMYEDVARVLRSVPAPVDLDTEPEILRIYQDLVRTQARPFLELSRSAYRACSLNADHPAGMRHFSTFCRERLDQLPEAEAPAAGTTEVEIVRD